MSSGAGNRQDNRQRGNAAQLLEKYKGLARDTQMQGDRVQTEYYLQFAEHYYRILNENRARFEEQRRQRGEGGYEAGYEEDESEELEAASEARDRDPGEVGEPSEARESREPREDRGRREGRREPRRDGNGEYRGRYRERSSGGERDNYAAGERDNYNAGDRENYAEPDEGQSDERIAADILPPSIGTTDADEGEEAPRAPRRRPRRPRDDSEEVAPAA